MKALLHGRAKFAARPNAVGANRQPCAVAIAQVPVSMNMHERFAAPEVILVGAETAGRTSRLRLLRTCVARWAKTFTDCYAAAAAYEDLSRLSDTQLKHRGLSRDILARDLSE